MAHGTSLRPYLDSVYAEWHVLSLDVDAEFDALLFDEVAAVDPDSFPAKNVFQRMSIIAAGPFANILFAVVALALLFMIVGRPFTPAMVGNIEEGSPAEAAGLLPFDHVIAVDGSEIESFEEFRTIERESAETELLVTVDREGKRLELPMTPALVLREDQRLDQTFEIGDLGIGPPLTPADVANVRTGGAAEEAGLLAGVGGGSNREQATGGHPGHRGRELDVRALGRVGAGRLGRRRDQGRAPRGG